MPVFGAFSGFWEFLLVKKSVTATFLPEVDGYLPFSGLRPGCSYFCIAAFKNGKAGSVEMIFNSSGIEVSLSRNLNTALALFR